MLVYTAVVVCFLICKWTACACWIMKDKIELKKIKNKALLGYLFHPLSTKISLYNNFISFILIQFKNASGWRSFPWDIIHSLWDLSMGKNVLIHNIPSSLWNSIPLPLGTHPKSIFLFLPLFVTFESVQLIPPAPIQQSLKMKHRMHGVTRDHRSSSCPHPPAVNRVISK